MQKYDQGKEFTKRGEKKLISHLVAKLQFIRCQHDDVIINGKHSFCLNLIIGEKTVAQFVLFGSHDFQRNTNFWPKRLCQKGGKYDSLIVSQTKIKN